MPRNPRSPRLLVTDGGTYLWNHRHSHDASPSGGGVNCRQTLMLYPQPAGTGGSLRIVFAEGPDRYVPGGAPLGSGDVGYVRGGSLNLHEPGAVRALLDAALSAGWQPHDKRPLELDGWPLLLAATTEKAAGTEEP
ncbi:hypothetical protein OG900_28420 [Streptomyces sp. NBC_00433]